MNNKKQIVVDVHTHIFNSLFLPLKGIFKFKFGFSIPVSWALETIIITATKVNHMITFREIWNIDLDSTDSSKHIIDNLYFMVKEELFRQSCIDENRIVQETDLHASLVELEKYYIDKGHTSVKTILNLYNSFSFQSIKKQRDEFFSMIDDRFKKPFKYVMEKLDSVGVHETNDFDAKGSILKFLYLMISKENTIISKLQDAQNNNVILHIHHMMDMEKSFEKKYLKSRPYYSYEKTQIKRMAKVTKDHNGKILGFVAFHPEREKTEETIFNGLRNGNIGVKIYPPLGYKPDYENSRQKEIYKLCTEKRIPILTHCTPVGFEARKCDGLNSDPNNWESVLIKCHELPLCLGHGGGGFYKLDCKENNDQQNYYGWLATNQEQWSKGNYARKVVDLCVNYPNVYCDMSHLHQILNKDLPSGLVDQFNRSAFEIIRDRLITVIEEFPEFAKKIMYGSDWHMVKMLNRTDSFLKAFINLFSHEKLSKYKDDFFYINALRWLNIPEFICRHQKQNPTFLNKETIDYLTKLSTLPAQ